MASVTRSHSHFATLSTQPGDELIFRQNYNTVPFVLKHKLAGHPLLQVSHLTDLAQRLTKTSPGQVYYDVGRAITDRGWDYETERPFSAAEAIQRIETSNAWMILKKLQVLPEYGEVLNLILREIHELSGRDFEKTTHTRNISVILTSPNRITPYHMDADCNYLLQLAGSKTAYVFNGSDRRVVTTAELERFYSGEINAAQYKEESQKTAWRFDMTPGDGIHVPVVFPHWVQNGNNISISASINFMFADRPAADVYRVNHYLRRAHLSPKAPGESALSDGVKRLAIKATKAVLRRHAS